MSFFGPVHSTGSSHPSPDHNRLGSELDRIAKDRHPTARAPRGKPKSKCNIRGIDANVVVDILSHLEHPDILRFGLTCKENLMLISHARLWTVVHIKNARMMDIRGLKKIISHSSTAMPLKSLAIRTAKCCVCEGRGASIACRNCAHVDTTTECVDGQHCDSCVTLEPVLHKLSYLRNLIVEGMQCLSLCPFKAVLRSATHLTRLDFTNDCDINIVVPTVARACKHLEGLTFRYIHILDHDVRPRRSHPVLHPDVAHELVVGCPLLKQLRLCHYTVNEESVYTLLGLAEVEDVDLSDNEGLRGMFLQSVPEKWKKLRRLVLRDCTELNHDCVNHFANELIHRRSDEEFLHCTHLHLVDVSCQWAFFGDSLIDADVLSQLRTFRGSTLRWREDQCEIEGFGVDPDAGVDNIDHDELEGLEETEVLAEYGDSSDDESVYMLPDVMVDV